MNKPDMKKRKKKIIHCGVWEQCGKIRDYRSQSKLCIICYYKTIFGQNSPIWNGVKPKCLDCKKIER